MSDTDIRRAQALLHGWLSQRGKVRYQIVKEACEYLNASMQLGLLSPTGSLFWPLIRTGVADFAGSGCYALAPPAVLAFKDHAYAINVCEDRSSTPAAGISICPVNQLPATPKAQRLSSLSVLRTFPTVQDVAMSWPVVRLNGAELTYHGRKKLGISKPERAGQVRYFNDPRQRGVRKMPSVQVNPEAYPVAVCYQNVITCRPNGMYNEGEQILEMNLYGLSVLLSRALMVDGMAAGRFPQEQGRHIVFYNISKPVVKELNRIMCKSINIYERPH